MPIITPDLSETNQPIPPGTYPNKIVSVDYKTSSAGNPMIVVKCDIDVDGKRKVRNSYLVITGAGAFGFESLLRSCHFEDVANSLKSNPIPFDTDQLINQENLVVVESDTYNGAITDRITGFLPK